MMNAIAVQIMSFLMRGPLIDPVQRDAASQILQSARLLEAYSLPQLSPTRLHLGLVIAVLLAVAVYFLFWRTTLGYRIRAVGLSQPASKYGDINVKKHIVVALLLSDAFAELAGML